MAMLAMPLMRQGGWMCVARTVADSGNTVAVSACLYVEYAQPCIGNVASTGVPLLSSS